MWSNTYTPPPPCSPRHVGFSDRQPDYTYDDYVTYLQYVLTCHLSISSAGCDGIPNIPNLQFKVE